MKTQFLTISAFLVVLAVIFNILSIKNTPTVSAATAGPGEFGDLVWYDTNANGLQDAGEAGVAGLNVYLLSQNTNINGVLGFSKVATARTNATGNYKFSVTQADTDITDSVGYVASLSAGKTYVVSYADYSSTTETNTVNTMVLSNYVPTLYNVTGNTINSDLPRANERISFVAPADTNTISTFDTFDMGLCQIDPAGTVDSNSVPLCVVGQVNSSTSSSSSSVVSSSLSSVASSTTNSSSLPTLAGVYADIDCTFWNGTLNNCSSELEPSGNPRYTSADTVPLIKTPSTSYWNANNGASLTMNVSGINTTGVAITGVTIVVKYDSTKAKPYALTYTAPGGSIPFSFVQTDTNTITATNVTIPAGGLWGSVSMDLLTKATVGPATFSVFMNTTSAQISPNSTTVWTQGQTPTSLTSSSSSLTILASSIASVNSSIVSSVVASSVTSSLTSSVTNSSVPTVAKLANVYSDIDCTYYDGAVWNCSQFVAPTNSPLYSWADSIGRKNPPSTSIYNANVGSSIDLSFNGINGTGVAITNGQIVVTYDSAKIKPYSLSYKAPNGTVLFTMVQTNANTLTSPANLTIPTGGLWGYVSFQFINKAVIGPIQVSSYILAQGKQTDTNTISIKTLGQ